MSVSGLRHLVTMAEKRVAMAEAIGWPALADSWRRDVERHRAELWRLFQVRE